MIAVFIAGGSASGKTKLADQLLAKLHQLNINSLCVKMDDYYQEIPKGRDLYQYKKMTNFDHPNCLDFRLLKEHIMTLKQGKPIDKPVFDFKIECRVRTEPIAPPTILLIEGTAALFFSEHWVPDLSPAYKIFIEANQETLLKRRIQRDLRERGYTDQLSILKKDAEFVRPTFLTFIEPTKQFADMLIDNNETDDTAELAPLMRSAVKVIEALRKIVN